MVKGKNYANRKPESERPLNDFYPTPSCMVKELIESELSVFNSGIENKIILDPCCGNICNRKCLEGKRHC